LTRRSRGEALDRGRAKWGARVATGQILAFVDADSQLDPDTFNAIERTLESGPVVVGATGARMGRISPGIALSMLLLTLMIQLAGFEIGAVFCRRADWERIGGYNEERLLRRTLSS
jgi:cellulose synthase/poly-beta-1,6-N-acetylglucosamine synthase-like glycosyltransferase